VSGKDQFTICEGDGAGGYVKLVFYFVGPGQYKALIMNYGSNDVLDNPISVFNHMGYILFRGSQGVKFNAFEYSDDFYVTVPAFGGQLKTIEGKCIKVDAENPPARRVLGLGKLGNGIFGSCSDLNRIGYIGMAKTYALGDAENQCSPLKSHQISDFEVTTTCENGYKTAVVKALFECHY
jgi:hypothetical protein